MSSNAERQKALRERRAAAGLVQVLVWVPEKYKERLKNYVRRLCK